jgi:cytochrome b6-f complex iron-sulfur subunit
MSPAVFAFVGVALGLLAFVLFILNVTVRRQRKAAAASKEEQREHAAAAGPATVAETDTTETTPEVTVEKVPPKARKPLTPGQLAVSRRQFLNRAWTFSFLGFLGFFGMSSLSFLWPKLSGGFGTKITAGNYEDLLAAVGPEGNFVPQYFSEGRFYLTYYEGNGDAPVYEATNAVDTKLVALYRKCVHLGCSPPFCSTSYLFECPCHGSKYRLNGEFFYGPAPRGLDRFPVTIEGGNVVVDTGALQVGPPRGTDTWPKYSQPAGQYCIPT